MILGTAKRTREGEDKKPTRYFSDLQEKSVANAVGARQTKNSGATPFQKGDCLTSGKNSFLIECKTKTSHSNSISIKKEWFAKIKEEAFSMNKEHSVLVFNFGPGEENHYVIDEYLFQALKEYLNNFDENI